MDITDNQYIQAYNEIGHEHFDQGSDKQLIEWGNSDEKINQMKVYVVRYGVTSDALIYAVLNNICGGKNVIHTSVIRQCGFQYYDGNKVVCDKYNLTLEEAKQLWNEHYIDMVEKATDSEDVEVAIWINMKDDSDYRETLIHLSSPRVKHGKLCETKYHDVFNIVPNICVKSVLNNLKQNNEKQ